MKFTLQPLSGHAGENPAQFYIRPARPRAGCRITLKNDQHISGNRDEDQTVKAWLSWDLNCKGWCWSFVIGEICAATRNQALITRRLEGVG